MFTFLLTSCFKMAWHSVKYKMWWVLGSVNFRPSVLCMVKEIKAPQRKQHSCCCCYVQYSSASGNKIQTKFVITVIDIYSSCGVSLIFHSISLYGWKINEIVMRKQRRFSDQSLFFLLSEIVTSVKCVSVCTYCCAWDSYVWYKLLFLSQLFFFLSVSIHWKIFTRRHLDRVCVWVPVTVRPYSFHSQKAVVRCVFGVHCRVPFVVYIVVYTIFCI